MKRLLHVGLVMGCVALAACGGGSGSDGAATVNSGNTGNPSNNQAPSTTTLSPYYKGTYKTNTITSWTPFFLTLNQSGTNLTGSMASAKINGTVTGTVIGNNVVITVIEPNGGQVVITGTVAGSILTISSIIGGDAFGNITSGTGSCTAQAAPPAAIVSPSYNGIAILNNSSNLPAAASYGVKPFAPASGRYPVRVAGLSPDGSGNYGGSYTSQFLSGSLSLIWYPVAQAYGTTVYQTGDYNWGGTNSGFGYIASSLDRLDGSTASFVYSTTELHPGDIRHDLAGTWTYTGTAATGVQSLTLTIASPDGINFTTGVSVTIRHINGGPLDTVTGALNGVYDVLPHPNPAIPNTGYAIRFGASPASSLIISNPSTLTPGLTVYLSYLDKVAGTISVDVDTGVSTNYFLNPSGIFRGIILSKQ